MAKTVPWDLEYDRRVSSQFLELFRSGPASTLVEIARAARYPVDLQFRHSPKDNREHASLYVGLTDVLTVEVAPKTSQLRLKAHKTRSDTAGKAKTQDYGFETSWGAGLSDDDWPAVEAYLDRVIPTATETYGGTEGGVQAAISTNSSNKLGMLDREAALHFKDTATKNRIFAEVTGPIVEALAGVSGVKGIPKVTYGGECDLLAVDGDRLLAIEVKPRDVGTIRWAAAQATVYARLFERWLQSGPHRPEPVEVLRGLWDQRASLGLTPSRPTSSLRVRPKAVPVVVVQRGTRTALLEECGAVQQRLVQQGVGYDSLRLYEAGISGRLTLLEM